MYKYFAFISYNCKDTVWGKRLQRKLENYRLPSTLCSERGWKRKPINPVFFAPSDIQPGGLNAELQERLRASRNLIVICSPSSAKSEWVGKEIEYFHSLGRDEHIHFFIVEGIPHSGNADTECFNPVVASLGLPEILGANIHERISPWPWINRERAYVQLITKLLGVEFDSIWKRHRRLMIQTCISWIAGMFAVCGALLGVWINNQPVDVRLMLKEASACNEHLPSLRNALVSIIMENEVKSDTVFSFDTPALFVNIPHRALGRESRIMVSCNDWLSVDTTIVLSQTMYVNMFRNPHTYGDISFRLWNPDEEKLYPGEELAINGHSAISGADGMVRYFMPLPEQDTIYTVTSSLNLAETALYMPTSESTMLEVR